MTNLLLTVLLVGAAVTYVLETLDILLLGWFEKSTINLVFSLPLSFGGFYVMSQEVSLQMFATVPAATFISLVLLKYINKPQQVEMRRVPRI